MLYSLVLPLLLLLLPLSLLLLLLLHGSAGFAITALCHALIGRGSAAFVNFITPGSEMEKEMCGIVFICVCVCVCVCVCACACARLLLVRQSVRSSFSSYVRPSSILTLCPSVLSECQYPPSVRPSSILTLCPSVLSECQYPPSVRRSFQPLSVRSSVHPSVGISVDPSVRPSVRASDRATAARPSVAASVCISFRPPILPTRAVCVSSETRSRKNLSELSGSRRSMANERHQICSLRAFCLVLFSSESIFFRRRVSTASAKSDDSVDVVAF